MESSLNREAKKDAQLHALLYQYGIDKEAVSITFTQQQLLKLMRDVLETGMQFDVMKTKYKGEGK